MRIWICRRWIRSLLRYGSGSVEFPWLFPDPDSFIAFYFESWGRIRFGWKIMNIYKKISKCHYFVPFKSWLFIGIYIWMLAWFTMKLHTIAHSMATIWLYISEQWLKRKILSRQERKRKKEVEMVYIMYIYTYIYIYIYIYMYLYILLPNWYGQFNIPTCPFSNRRKENICRANQSFFSASIFLSWKSLLSFTHLI